MVLGEMGVVWVRRNQSDHHFPSIGITPVHRHGSYPTGQRRIPTSRERSEMGLILGGRRPACPSSIGRRGMGMKLREVKKRDQLICAGCDK